MIRTIQSTCAAVVLVTICFFGQVSLTDYQKCIGELCFKIPASTDEMNANAWCENNGNYSFAGITDYGMQDVVLQFLNSQPQSVSNVSLYYVNIRRKCSENSASTWYLLNGIRYEGSIDDQNASLYKYHSFIKVDNNNYHVVASKPGDQRQFICSFNETTCSSLSSKGTFTYSYKGRCFVIYENESLSWFEARNRCTSKGGDLATFNFPDESGNKQPTTYIWVVPFNTTWLNSSLTFWVGIRWKSCKWNSPGDSQMEIVYTNWKTDGRNDEPNDVYFECVCLDPNANPRWSWIDCDCNQQREFLCVKLVPTTTPLTTTAMETTTTMTSFINATNPTKPSSDNSSVTHLGNGDAEQKNLAIGLGAGIGGAAFILLVVGIIIAVVKIKRKRLSNVNSKSLTNKEPVDQQNSVNVSSHTNSSEVYAAVVPDLMNSQDFGKEEQTKSETVYAVTQFTQQKNLDLL